MVARDHVADDVWGGRICAVDPTAVMDRDRVVDDQIVGDPRRGGASTEDPGAANKVRRVIGNDVVGNLGRGSIAVDTAARVNSGIGGDDVSDDGRCCC